MLGDSHKNFDKRLHDSNLTDNKTVDIFLALLHVVLIDWLCPKIWEAYRHTHVRVSVFYLNRNL